MSLLTRWMCVCVVWVCMAAGVWVWVSMCVAAFGSGCVEYSWGVGVLPTSREET